MKKTIFVCIALLFVTAIVSCEMMDTSDDLSVETTSAALLSPDQDLKDFPPWIWPIIHPVDIFSNAVTGRDLTFDQAAEMIKLSATKLCECSTTGRYSFDQLLGMINASFDMQYTALNFAKIKAAGLGKDKSVYEWDDGDWCGTPPKPWPWPWPWLDLIYFEKEVFMDTLPQWYKLNREEMKILDSSLSQQLERFERLAKE